MLVTGLDEHHPQPRVIYTEVIILEVDLVVRRACSFIDE